jgi:hypothetical protein
VRVERRSEVLHDGLADDVVQVALAQTDDAAEDRQHDHQPDENVQQQEVAVRDRDVDQEFQKDRVDQPDEARGEDRDEHDAHLEPVRLEERDDPADRPSAPLLRDRRFRRAGHEPAPGAAAASGAASAGAGARLGPHPSESASAAHPSDATTRAPARDTNGWRPSRLAPPTRLT